MNIYIILARISNITLCYNKPLNIHKIMCVHLKKILNNVIVFCRIYYKCFSNMDTKIAYSRTCHMCHKLDNVPPFYEIIHYLSLTYTPVQTDVHIEKSTFAHN